MKLLQKYAVFALLLFGLMATVVFADDTITITSRGTTNVRSGPGTTYTIIDRLFEGDTVTANGRSDTSNSWLRVDVDGSEGWVSASVVTLNGDPTSLAVVSASGDAESVVGQTGVEATFDAAGNVRFGPGTSYPVIAQAAAGDSYDITGRTDWANTVVCRDGNLIDTARGTAPENVWLRLNFQGANGWVNYSIVTVSGNLCDVAVAEADDFSDIEAETGIAFGQVLVITTDSVRLRASNYSNSEVLAVIPYDTSLVAEARNESGNRIRVTYQGQTGWITTAYLYVSLGSLDDLEVAGD
jgi:uncharacterized protein YraI